MSSAESNPTPRILDIKEARWLLNRAHQKDTPKTPAVHNIRDLYELMDYAAPTPVPPEARREMRDTITSDMEIGTAVQTCRDILRRHLEVIFTPSIDQNIEQCRRSIEGYRQIAASLAQSGTPDYKSLHTISKQIPSAGDSSLVATMLDSLADDPSPDLSPFFEDLPRRIERKIKSLGRFMQRLQSMKSGAATNPTQES